MDRPCYIHQLTPSYILYFLSPSRTSIPHRRINMAINRCIFCKSADREFTSREHIVPESLGNTEHILEPGVVCDWCNNYFARKIEDPILSSTFFIQARHRLLIQNKRQRIPPIDVLSYPNPLHLQLGATPDSERSLYAANDCDNNAFIDMIRNHDRFSIRFPVAELPTGRLFARFLAMIAVEALAKQVLDAAGDLKADLTDKRELEEIRRFTRFGEGIDEWPFSARRLYAEGQHFTDDDGMISEVLHEYMFLYTDLKELYFVIVIFGIEFAINLGGPEIDGYNEWLTKNSGRSPLYPKSI